MAIVSCDIPASLTEGGRRPAWPFAPAWDHPQGPRLVYWFSDMAPRSLARGVKGSPAITFNQQARSYRTPWGACRAYSSASTYDTFTLSLGTRRMIFLAWFYPTAAQNQYAGLLLSRSSAAVGLCFTAVGALTCNWNDTVSEYDAATGLTPVVGEWNLLGGSHHDTTTDVYLASPSSGIKSASIGVTDTFRSPSAWYQGNDSWDLSTRYMKGDLADARILDNGGTVAAPLFTAGHFAAIYRAESKYALYRKL